MGQRKVQAFFARIDALYADTLKGGYDEDLSWDAIATLRRSGSYAVFRRAANWCSSTHPLKRARAAAILAQLRRAEQRPGHYKEPEWMFRAESFEIITQMLKEEKDTYALSAEIAALGHLYNAAAVPFIVAYADHPNESVRFSVAFALGCYPDDPVPVSVLEELMEDAARDVRDWAIFGLGVQGNADSEEIRMKLLDHLNDPFLDARMEAAAALGKRHDARLAKPLIQMLRKDGSLYGLVEAAQELLELSETPTDWFEAEYIAALESRFPDVQ